MIGSQRARQAREAQPLRAAAQTRTSIPAVMCVSRRHGPLGFGPGRAGRDGRKRGTRVLTAGGAGGWEARRAYTADAARHHADAEERARARAELRLQRERAQKRHLRRPGKAAPLGRRNTPVGCGRGASRAPGRRQQMGAEAPTMSVARGHGAAAAAEGVWWPHRLLRELGRGQPQVCTRAGPCWHTA